MNVPGKPAGINNTAFLFGTVAFAFVLWVTARGDLPKWLGLLGIGSASAAPTSGGTVANPGAPSLPTLPTLPSFGAFGAATSDSAASAPGLGLR